MTLDGETDAQDFPTHLGRAVSLLAIDLDGTLLGDDDQVSAANREALRRAGEHGLHVVLATGRRYRTTRFVMDRMAMPLPAICLGGALVKDAAGGVLQREPFVPALVAALLALARSHRLALLLHRDSHEQGGADFVIDASVPWNRETRRYMDVNGATGQPDAEPEQAGCGNVLMVGCFAERKRLAQLQRGIDRMGTFSTVLVESKKTPGWYLETTLGHVNKWWALERYAAALGIESEAGIAAVGDALNDLPMIRGAGLGVAVGNAESALRNAANWMTRSNNDNGVAVLIDHLIASRSG